MLISYKEPDQYLVASWLLAGADKEQKLHKLDQQNLTIEIEHETMCHMLERIRDSQAILFPYLDQTKVIAAWMLAAPTLYQLEQARVRIQYLLVPAYAGFPIRVPAATLQGTSDILRARVRLYPHGYYKLHSRLEYTNDIFHRLDLWIRLEEERPKVQAIVAYPTYGELYERFHQALAETHWEEAEQVRHEMQRRNLTTAENLLFLEIEGLARRQRWHEIWQRDDFASLARVPIPRAVRGALLTAFHQVVLLPKEQQGDWQGALEDFTMQQPKLGLLLSARLGLAQGPVVQVFAYQAARNNRTELQELITATTDLAALECVKQLLRLGENTPIHEEKAVPASALKLAGAALEEANYDLAVRYVQQIDSDEARLVLLLRISFYTRDVRLAEDALLLYWNLPSEQLAELKQRYPFISAIASDLVQLIAPEIPEQEVKALQSSSIKTWLDWFQRVLTLPDDPNLLVAQATLMQITDERFWEPDRLVTLNELLLQLVLDDRLVVLPVVRDALGKLITFFLNEPDFPRTERIYQDLYESFYAALLARSAREEMQSALILLHLADAILRTTPGKCETVLVNLKQWSGAPLPKMELWILDAYEMLIDYGLFPQQLASWCREWLEWLLMIPHSEQSQWRTWLLLTQIIQPGKDLLLRLEQKLKGSSELEEVDALSFFAANYKVGIFSLREGAAHRARELLLARNASLDVRICTDTVLTDSAKALAQNADLVVLVTTALTHSLVYGISPHLNEQTIVYPQSSGSSSILRAVEEYARKQHSEAI